LETIFQMMGPLLSVYQLTGEQQQRLGSGIPYTVPRGTFECSDGKWVGVSASSDSVAARVLDILGVANDPRFATFNLRVEHRQELNELLISWCAARPQEEVLRIFEEADAAIGPVYDMADINDDPHFAARNMIQHLEGTPMQGLIAHLSHTPGALRWQGRAQDADGESIRNNGWGTTSR
jgi:crotonobetainyl-CoA:carnitine CoA-transferase CaiB-like acyl-CoA transferase